LWVSHELGLPVELTRLRGGNSRQTWVAARNDPDSGDTPIDGLSWIVRVDPAPDPGDLYPLEREGRIYRGLNKVAAPVPKLVSMSADGSALLMEHLSGSTDVRSLEGSERRRITAVFLDDLARVHLARLEEMALSDLLPHRSANVAECVESEIDRWERTLRGSEVPADPLIEFGICWLRANIPAGGGKPVLVHGDAGPGNFLFDDGRITGIIDWELAHAGEPMEDLAWVGLRATLDRVPDLGSLMRIHCESEGIEADERRLLFYEALVLWKVLVIRQRAVGDVTRNLGRNVYYRLVQRRMFVDVMSRALGRPEPAPPTPPEGDTSRSWLFDACVHHIKTTALPSLDPESASTMAGLIRVLRYLRLWEAAGTRPSYRPGEAGEATRYAIIDPVDAFDDLASDVIWEHELCRGLLGADADLRMPSLG
jgi:aminoglycoside phosphotransferase (APT) family kinase protein